MKRAHRGQAGQKQGRKKGALELHQVLINPALWWMKWWISTIK
jgi:hypothetical protein